MSPDLRIRNVDQLTYDRLRERASANSRSVESELRVILADATGNASSIGATRWEQAGFDEVKEVHPGRLYEAVALGERYRIGISRNILGGGPTWQSEIDKIEDIDGHSVWTHPIGIPSRLFGETAEVALGDAMRWLSQWGGFDKMGRARRDAEAAERMAPPLRNVADALDDLLQMKEAWRDETRARWSTDDYDFFISNSGDAIALMAYRANTNELAFAPTRFSIEPEVARSIAETIFLHIAGEGEPVKHSRRPPHET